MDISTLNGSDGKWYPIPGWDGARIQIARPSPGKMEDMVRQVTKKRFRRGKVYEDQNTEHLSRLLCDASILNWEKIEENGEPIPVTLDNKLRLLRDYDIIQALWQEVIGTEVDVQEAIQEADLKN